MDFSVLLPGSGLRAIPELSLPGALRLLVLSPHPDDFDAVGITLVHMP